MKTRVAGATPHSLTATPAPSHAPILRFLGAAGTVTGSKFLVDTGRARVLLDAGLFQGPRVLRERNRAPFPADIASIDAVVLTHAHLDHVGYLPVLTRRGYNGPIYATQHTAELAAIVLADSGRLQEEDAEYANRKAFSKHHPAEPLYTEEDALAAAARITAIPRHKDVDVAPGVIAHLRRAGHILGSATVELRFGDHGVVFSGDLGRDHHPLLAPPEDPPATGTMLIESTYGNRRHEDEAMSLAELAGAINRTAERGGVVVIPAFAVDRTEVVLYHLEHLMRAGEIPRLPIYVDSPMSLSVLGVYQRALIGNDPDIRVPLAGHDALDIGDVHESRTVAESRALNDITTGIIVSSSGMATGGRVLHHLSRRLPDKRSSVVLVGYQAAGTRGDALAHGAKALKMFGTYVAVEAEIIQIQGFSVHADGDELVAWASRTGTSPTTTYVIHGEPDASRCLQNRLHDELNRLAVVPAPDEHVRLG